MAAEDERPSDEPVAGPIAIAVDVNDADEAPRECGRR